MEIANAKGSNSNTKILINPGQSRELGRANGFNSLDRTISRRHVSFFNSSGSQNRDRRLQFEVIGVNPIYLCSHGEVKVFRRFERGEMESGDLFCVSAKNPIWYALKNVDNGGERAVESVMESELAGSLESGLEFNRVEEFQTEDVDFSGVDHVREFGFVVMGHEFDSYPKKRIRDFKNWNWFLGESDEDTEDDEKKGKKATVNGKRKWKKGREKDDEDWTGESEDDKELLSKSRMVQKPSYMTRSKDPGKPSKRKGKIKTTAGKNSAITDDEDMEEEDEDDETLGGFIVGDDNLEKVEESGNDGEEEEEKEEELEDAYDEDE